MSDGGFPDERVRSRRIRFTAPPKPNRDAGPLLIRLADGARLFHNGKLRGILSAGTDRIDMVYPTAPTGRLSLRPWIARWCPAAPQPAYLVDMLLCGVPSYLSFLPFLLLQAPDDAIRGGLIVGTMLLFLASRRSENRLRRDESLRIHARFWDHLLRSPPLSADPDDLSSDARSQAFQLKQALNGALTAARAVRRVAVGAVSLAVALLGLTFVQPSVSSSVLWAFPVGAFLLGALTAQGRGWVHARLDLETDKLDRIESRYTSRMPLLRQLGLGERVFAELENSARHQARMAFWGALARTIDKLLPGVVAASALAFTLQEPEPRGNELPALLLFIPAVHGSVRLGQHVARLWAARCRIVEAQAVLIPSTANHEPGPSVVSEVGLIDIRFRHSAAAAPLIDNVSFVLKRGDAVALTGPSGCGKSTLLDILTGLCRPQSGRLSVNGHEVPWDSLSGYRTRIARVFQDSLAAASTIRNAISSVAPEASDEDIRRAAEDAGLSPLLASLPMGFETLLVEGALPASLLQQVLVAQALAQEPDLLVLDETLSVLDLDVAQGIIAAARRRNIILLYATHREDLAALADRRIDLPPSLERNAGIAG
ncbi:ATP-binding cassette domain-containing protein [Pleomorphomonas sp. JP5]|uniref:ATP-binding cassette domain-containing protein n=1 Tax=Pleomorphomonas sp. JP5 TaxID=2942998 RepID=UPI0020434C0B|nr:ATP-binding cassette domain-containing protein [Pleomorphomonas sp. JP5]MCM5558961.1 ATP-binding cassette domain-containing protein [Pleomorphomonas sp. JP5]